MAEYYNAAGRILTIFKKLDTITDRQTKMSELCTTLGLTEGPRYLLLAQADLLLESDILEIEIEQFKHDPHKYTLHKQTLEDVRQRIKLIRFDFNSAGNNQGFKVHKSILAALEYMAAELVQDQPAPADELNKLRSLANELQSEIEQSESIKGKTKEWLLDLVRIIRDSLDRYGIRGSRGMRQQVAMLVGELMLNHGLREEIKTKDPSIWAKIMATVDGMNNIASLAEKCKPALGAGVKLLTYVKEHYISP